MIKNNSLVRVAVGLVLFSAPVLPVGASDLPSSDHAISMKKRCEPVIRSVDFRKDLTRVYATLNGIPHTAFRIDRIVMVTPSGKSYLFTDIDGIDAKRYFQWEDDGKIDIEIDFPAMKAISDFRLEFYGPDNEKIISIYKKSQYKKSHKRK